MSNDSEVSGMKEARGIVKKRIFVNAFEKGESIDARTVNRLAREGYLPEDKIEPLSGELIDALASDKRGRVLVAPEGPLLFRQVEDGRQVISVPELVFVPNCNGRKAVTEYFERMGVQGNVKTLSERTRERLASWKPQLLSAEVGWRKAAEQVYDALTSDYYLQLAELRQSATMSFDEGIRDSLPAVLHPDIETINSIQSHFQDPMHDLQGVARWTESLTIGNGDLEDALHRWYEALGHLPLAKEGSLCSLVDAWCQIHGSISNVWDRLWAWSAALGSPYAEYHVATYFLKKAKTLNKAERIELWRVCDETISAGCPWDSDHVSSAKELRWVARARVAQHYIQYLECVLPARAGDACPALAWWLADQVVAVWEPFAPQLEGFYSITMEQVEGDSRVLRQIAHPLSDPSSLRYSTLYGRLLWAGAVATQLTDLIDVTEISDIDVDARKRLSDGLAQQLLECCPYWASDTKVYAFESSLLTVAEKWGVRLAADNEAKSLVAAVLLGRESGKKEYLSVLLDAVSNPSDDDQIVSAYMLRALAYTGRLDAQILWRRFVDDKTWRKSVLGTIRIEGIEVLVDTLIEVSLRSGVKWRSHLPHFLALAVNETCDAERRRYLVLGTIWASIATDTIGAIQRLATGQQRHNILGDVERFRDLLTRLQSYAPAWLRSRLGSTLSVLHWI